VQEMKSAINFSNRTIFEAVKSYFQGSFSAIMIKLNPYLAQNYYLPKVLRICNFKNGIYKNYFILKGSIEADERNDIQSSHF